MKNTNNESFEDVYTKTKKQSAITLIALVITIIVLLILAGVTISTLSGENGLLARVKEGKVEHEKAQIIEEMKLEIYETTVATMKTENRNANIKDFIENVENNDESKNKINFKSVGERLATVNQIVVDNLETLNENSYVTVEYKTYDFDISFNLEIIKVYQTEENKTIYNVTKQLSEGINIDNTADNVLFNTTYNATITAMSGYGINTIIVTMGGETVNVDSSTGIIDIQNVTGDIVITATSKIITKLYTYGDEHTTTGGWQLNKDTYSLSDIDSYDYMLLNSPEVSFRGSSITTKNAIDLSNYKKLKMLITKQNIGTYHYFRIGINSTLIKGVAYNAFNDVNLTKTILEDGENFVVELDIENISGSYYIGADLDTAIVKIFEIWLE